MLAASVLAGCNIVGPLYAVVAGPPKQDARYILPKDRVSVVFVDDTQEVLRLRKRALLRRIGERATEIILQEKELVDRMIRPSDPLALASSADRAGELLPVAEIGRRVDAEVMIYIQLTSFREMSNGEPRPNASAIIRVIDVEAGTILWPPAIGPDQSENGGVTAALPPVDPQAYSTTSGRIRVYEALAEALGEQIAKVFYKHEIRELGRNLNDDRQGF